MNFLAHLYLSGDDPKVMVGNFIGDFVKGKNLADRFEPTIVLGIELHRGIDHFTDTHKIVQQSKKRLAGKYRHYSGVIVDMFFDHFLSSKWSDYHNDELEVYAKKAYKVLLDHGDILPSDVNRFLPYMIKQNWLVAYSTFDGLSQALHGIASRTPYKSNMEHATEDLKELYEEFAGDFVAFFPQLTDFAKNYLKARDGKRSGA